MKNKTLSIGLIILLSAFTVVAQTTEFTYQGQLQSSSAPANGSFDFEFLLFDSLTAGAQIGSTLTRSGVAVANGIFSVKLDFGSNYPGANRFLEIHVVQTGGGAFIPLTPRQAVSSAPYSVKSLTADTATSAINAVNATNAANATNATNASTANGLSASCVGCVTNAQIGSVDGAKVTGTVANATNSTNATNATNATTATNALSLDGVAANQYLQTNGNGAALTNLNAASITTGTLSNARLGQIPTANIADNAVTSLKIASGQVVKGVTVGATTLTDNVTLAGSGNITITPSGNTLTIASTSGGVGGSGTTNTIPVWSNGTTLGNSVITQNGNGVQLPNGVQLAPGAQGNNVAFGSPNGETGLTIAGASGRADMRFGGSTLKLVAGPAGGPPAATNGIIIDTAGNVGIGIDPIPDYKLFVNTSTHVAAVYGQSSYSIGVKGISYAGTGVSGSVLFDGDGVYGNAGLGSGVHGVSTSSGVGVMAETQNLGGIALRTNGSSWFAGDTTPLRASLVGNGTGIVVGSSGGFGYIQAYDYGVNQTRTLALNHNGGRVGIGTTAPNQTLDVNGQARIRSIPVAPSVATVCFNAVGDLLNCGASSLKWKTNVQLYRNGLDIIQRLRPISFNWKEDGRPDIGLGAEDVAKVAPSFAYTNSKGEVEGVKYERLNILLINAVKEQQSQISQQQRQIDEQRKQIRGLTRTVRAINSRANARGRR